MKWRFLGFTAGTVALLALIAFVGGTQWFQSYLRGSDFLKLVATHTGRAFDANAAFEPLQWTGAAAYSEKVSLQGSPRSNLNQIEARQVRADVNWRAILDGAWRIEELQITRLSGTFGPSSERPEIPEPPPARPFFFSQWLPKRFELGRAVVSSADLSLGQVHASEVGLVVQPDGKGWIFTGSGGKLSAPRLPVVSIEKFRAREQDGEFFLTDSLIRLGETGKISASGANSKGGSLHVSWEGVAARDILAPPWNKRLSGVFSGSAVMVSSRESAGSFVLKDGRIEGIPVLGTVADFTGNPSFRRMPLQEFSASFSYRDGTLLLERIVVESKGLMRLEGTVQVDGEGRLAGQLEVGVTPQCLQWLPGSRERVFKTERAGYLWTSLEVGGTLQHPKEDLSTRLMAAMGTAVIDAGENAVKEIPATAVEGVRSILDILRPSVP